MAQWQAPESFAEFVRDRHAELLRFAYLLTGDRHLAEDLVQDGLERAGISWYRIRRKEDPEGYIRRIVVNRFLNRVRSLKRERLVAELPEIGTLGVEEAIDQTWRLLASLPRAQRAVLVLRFYVDLRETEIAAVLGCSVGAVKSNASRGLAKLRAALTEDQRIKGEVR